MKRVLNIVFSAVFAFSHTAFSASSATFDSSYKATRVSWMLKDFLSGKYAIDTSHLQKEDREYLALLRTKPLSKQVSKLKVSVRENVIVLNFENQAAAVIEIEADRIVLNGTPMKLNPSLSITQNLRNWGLNSKKNAAVLQPNLFWNVFVPEAHASPITDQASEVAQEIVSTGIDTFQTYASAVYTSRYAAAAVASGSAATVGTALIVTTASIIAGLAVVAVVACEAETAANSEHFKAAKSQERMNCYSKPLSWIDVNPRDRMYAQNVTCSQGKTAIDFESQTHKKAKIEIALRGNKLAAVKPNVPELREHLAKEAAYYQKLCKDTKALKAFQNAVAKSRSAGEVYTRTPANSATGVK